MNDTPIKMHKINVENINISDERLNQTFWKLDMEYSLSQRQSFKRLMPNIYSLKKRGMGFKQITEILTTHGFQLSQSTVTQYYYEFSSKMKGECEKKWRELTLIPPKNIK